MEKWLIVAGVCGTICISLITRAGFRVVTEVHLYSYKYSSQLILMYCVYTVGCFLLEKERKKSSLYRHDYWWWCNKARLVLPWWLRRRWRWWVQLFSSYPCRWMGAATFMPWNWGINVCATMELCRFFHSSMYFEFHVYMYIMCVTGSKLGKAESGLASSLAALTASWNLNPSVRRL